MRFLFVVSGKDVPSTRFRILPYLPLLEQAGHRCDVAYSYPQKYDYFRTLGWRLSRRLQRSVRSWHAFQAERKRYDAIVIEREVFDDDSWELEARFRAATDRLVLDMDDGVFLARPEKFEQILAMCDAAIGGNRWLTEYLAARCSKVELIPTCVKLADYTLRDPSRQRARRPHVGWIGTTQNVALLQFAAAGLVEVAREIPFRLVVVAPDDIRLAELELPGVEVEFREWSAKTEVAQVQDMDLGLMPLDSSQEWMKYKCALKLIQYLAVGIPGIASPIGVNTSILVGNQVGRAASCDAEWAAALRELLGSVALRQQLGAAGRRLVEQEYSVEGNWRKLEYVLCG